MGEDIILCQITSQHARSDAYIIDLKHTETVDGSLAVDSYIRTNMIFTADKKQIRMKFCKIPEEKYAKVIERITKIIKK